MSSVAVPPAVPTSPSMQVPRLSAHQLIDQLSWLQAYEIQCARLLGGWLPGVANWEAKHEMGLHLWQDAEHSHELRLRLWELRTPHPDRKVDTRLADVTTAFASAQVDVEFIAGLYLVLKKHLLEACRSIAGATSSVYDAPTIAILQRHIPRKEAQMQWARNELAKVSGDEEKQRRIARWTSYCEAALAANGGVTGTQSSSASAEDMPLPPGYHLLLPFPQAARDERFKMSLQGMKPPEGDAQEQTVFQFFNYSQEMQAAETLGSLLWETENMPWDFYYDVSRHCYDEIRHSALGEERLKSLGHKVTDFPNSAANYTWRQLMDPLHRYCALTYVIEADSFKYKHSTYQEYLKRNDVESAESVLFDILDETMHVRWGQKWVPKLMEAISYPMPLESLVKECREQVLANSVNSLQRQAAQRAAVQNMDVENVQSS